MSDQSEDQASILSEGAKELLQLILDYVAHDLAVPVQEQLASQMSVDKRTIERWTRELRESSILRVSGRRFARYQVVGLDRLGSVSGSVRIGNESSIPILTDPNRSKPPCPFCGAASHEQVLTDPNRLMGGGIPHAKHSDSSSPPTMRPETVLGEAMRWLCEQGFWPPTAKQLLIGPLAGCSLDSIKADFTRLWELGKRHGAIVETWRAMPPAPVLAASASTGPFSADYIKRYQQANGYSSDEESISDEQ